MEKIRVGREIQLEYYSDSHFYFLVFHFMSYSHGFLKLKKTDGTHLTVTESLR